MEAILSILFSGLIAAIVVGLITEHFARRRFRIENFERLRWELRDDQQLLAVKQKLAPGPYVALTESEKRDYLEFFELVGVYWKQKLIDQKLLNEILADYILDVYEHPDTKSFILNERNKLENEAYYENFVDLAKWLRATGATRKNGDSCQAKRGK